MLYGNPGTGKTTLCQGLAQKISIRLKDDYPDTMLIQIRTATLLSKYYSESAKKVDEIFTSIERMCKDDPERFICVLIDEVESIANSRESGAWLGETQETLRATNALLTGLDRVKYNSNIILLCTSNMFDSLDAAFLDRCGLKLAVNPPSTASQYTILRGCIQKLIRRGIILSKEVLPSYRDAKVDLELSKDLPSSKLLILVEQIGSINTHLSPLGSISGRSLSQLPEQALLRYMREEECDLDKSFRLIEQFIHAQAKEVSREKKSDELAFYPLPKAARHHGFKRGSNPGEGNAGDIESVLGVMEELISALRSRAQAKRKKI